MDAFTLTVNYLHKSEMGYNGKLGHTLGRVQHIYLMSIIHICYTACLLAAHTISPNLCGFQGIK